MLTRQTVMAGCIAGAVVACGGAGIEGIGNTMRDGGEALAGIGGAMVGEALAGAGGAAAGRSSAPPGAEAERSVTAGSGGAAGARAAIGGMLAAAGSAIAQAGRSMAGAAAGSGGSVAGAAAQEPAADGLPRPHWVLRDKSGAPVEADVQAGYGFSTVGFGSKPDCVSITHAGQRRIGLAYMLDTGKIALSNECMQGSVTAEQATWRPGSVWIFSDATCETPITYGPYYTVAIGGKLYHSATGAPQVPSTIYRWNADHATCDPAANASGVRYWAFAPVPQDVIDLLAQPPYTLELAY